MAVVARGAVAGQAFARTVYAIAGKRFTGDFALVEHSRRYRVTWRDGLIVGADSANPADSAARVALTAGLLTTTQVAEIVRQRAEHPETSEVALIAEMAGLSDRQRLTLARRALLQKAIRVFALPEASFELSDQASAPDSRDIAPIAVRTFIFRGLSAHYDLARLEAEMAAVAGAHFQLASSDEGARRRLAEYGFADAQIACVRHMARKPLTIEALQSLVSATNRKDILLTVYALLSTDDVKARRKKGASAPTRAPIGAPEPAPRPVPQPVIDTASRPIHRPATLPPHLSDGVPRPPPPGATSRQADESRPIDISALSVARARKAARSPSRTPARTSDRPPKRPLEHAPARPPERPDDRLKADEIRELIANRLRALDQGCDHYQLLGIKRDVAQPELRRAYFELAKKLHPDRLRALAIGDDDRGAQRLFATVNKAFAVLGNDQERARYNAALERGGTGDQARDRLEAEKKAMKLFTAEEHFLRGEQAMRGNRFTVALREFERALELNPDEAEHHALRAWATWCTATDKDAVLTQVQHGLERALHLSPKCVPAYFYRGQVAAACGHQKRALEDFRKVLKLRPSHREAELQVRLLQSRMERTASKRGRKK